MDDIHAALCRQAEDNLLTFQFEPGQFADPLSEDLGAKPGIPGYEHLGGIRDRLRSVVEGDWLVEDELKPAPPRAHPFPDPGRLPYRKLLQELQTHRKTKWQENHEYADAIEQELKRREESGDYRARHPQEMVAAMNLLRWADAVMMRDQWDFTGSPETQYHHRNWMPETTNAIDRREDSIDTYYEDMRRRRDMGQDKIDFETWLKQPV